MCILCVIQKWSRRVATMLPWLVIPLIGLWALSQLLPPAFRFEITSPRLACVFVLLVTLFWYEVLMPQLSAWRVRRNAWLRERKRTEAVELQKLRKTATRRCRNCLNPYRDQNPGGGRFMCSYCGHVSRRPVLELPVGPGPGNGPGLVRELVGKGSSWMCWGGSGGWAFRGDEDCLGDKSCCGAVFFACKVMAKVLERVRWLLGKFFIMVGLGRWECEGDDGEGRGVLGRGGENGVGTNESRGEKARRKAEEKRQARLERELFEEEERKQREEVAKMVEERRKKMRDERMEGQADKDHGKPVGLKAERKRQERRREKDRERDKGSSKSNSDVEEVEKRNGKDSEKKREFDKRSEIIRKEHQKQVDNVHSKSVVTNYNRTSAGNRYFDRVRGSIFSSSKAFGFGRGATNVSANAAKDNKFNSSVDHVYTASTRRDVGHTAAKSNTNGHERNTNHSVLPEPQPWTAPKKSWQQLFTRSSSVPQSSNSNVICRPNSKHQAEANSPQLSGQSSVTQSFDNPIHFGLPSPFNVTTYPNGSSSSSSLGFSRPTEPLFSTVGDAHDFRHEEQDIFEDPCYVPDPVSLLGPVSESIDDFQSDLGSSFVMDKDVDKPHSLKNSTSASEANNCRRLPIKSPLSRENYCQYPSTSKHQDVHAFHSDDATANAKGTWQMWNSAPLGQEGLGLIGDLRNWLLPSQRNIPNEDGFVLPPSQKPMASHFKRDDSIVSSTRSPKNAFLPSGQSSGTFGPVAGSSGYDPWLQTALFPHLSGGLKAHEGPTQNEMRYGSLNGSASNHVDDGSHANGWSKKEWPLHGSVETIENPSIATRTHIRAQQPPQDVQYSHFGDFYSKTG